MADLPDGLDPRFVELLEDGEQVAATGPCVATMLATPDDASGGAAVVCMTDRRTLVVFDATDLPPGMPRVMAVPHPDLRKMDAVDLGGTGGRVLRMVIDAPPAMQGRLPGKGGRAAEAFTFDLVMADELADGLAGWHRTLSDR